MSAETSGVDVAARIGRILDDAPRSRFHRRAVVISGMGFFTDAYDLFVIGTVASLVAHQWHLGTVAKSWVSASAILAAFVGAIVFGRIADVLGRKRVYTAVAAIMIVGALLSAVAPDLPLLLAARFLLGLGIGGDYPVSAVLMSEYANRRDRGRMVGMVFSMQALGLIVGPLVALVLLSSGLSHEVTWRLLLGLGAVPAAAVVWLRSRMPESPRFTSRVAGTPGAALVELQKFTGAPVAESDHGGADGHRGQTMPVGRRGPGGRLAGKRIRIDRRTLVLVFGTAGSWFLLDYALYGNTLSLSSILGDVAPHAALTSQLAWQLGLFVCFALPGYLLAVGLMDRIGHRRVQSIGFTVMAAAFGLLALLPPLTGHVAPFLLVFGISYLFIEFGPNTTTFVLPSEVFPVENRTTGHGVAAGVGKLGAFAGVFVVPVLQGAVGLRGMLGVATAASIAGLLVTRVLPEPARRSLDDVGAVAGVVPSSLLEPKPSSSGSEPQMRAG